MATATTSVRKEPQKIKFRFCRECSNLLYPKEDKQEERLTYACRTCHYSEDAETPLVYATDHGASAGETAGITQDVGSDPTVGDSAPEPGRDEDGFDVPICTMCGAEIICEICGAEPAEGGVVLEVEDWDPEAGAAQGSQGADRSYDDYDDEDSDDDGDEMEP